MRYVDGADLKQILRDEGALHPQRAFDLLAQVAEGLDEAHARGLVHRDVKPSNVLIARSETGAEHAYLADFGLTKTSTSETDARESITLSGSSDYVSPEQIRGTGSDTASDIYALGCIAYECLTGQVPFQRPGELEVLFAHMNDEPPPPSAVNVRLPGTLDPVLARSMAKEPGERYGSGSALVGAIRDAATPRRRRVGKRGAALITALLAAIVAAAVIPVLLTGSGQDGPVVGTITTGAGTGQAGFSGDGGPAIDAQLTLPWGPVVDDAGNLYFGELARVRGVDTDGIITTAAGSGARGHDGDGVPALEAEFEDPLPGLGPDGALYVMNRFEPILRRIEADGTIVKVAGTGFVGATLPADGSQASDVDLCGSVWRPISDNAGNIHFSCSHAVFRIDSAGVLSRVAGTGEEGFSGDGGPATEAKLFLPRDLAFDDAGNLYIADALNNRVRKVDPEGVITTIAGTGNRRHSGDGGPARLADLHVTQDVAVDSDGNLYVSFAVNPEPDADRLDPNVVRRIDTGDIITTVAGGGTLLGDQVLATEADLGNGSSLHIDLDARGNLYIAAEAGQRIHKVTFNR